MNTYIVTFETKKYGGRNWITKVEAANAKEARVKAEELWADKCFEIRLVSGALGTAPAHMFHICVKLDRNRDIDAAAELNPFKIDTHWRERGT